MSQGYGRGYRGGPVFGIGSPIPPGVRALLVANAVPFVLFNVLLFGIDPSARAVVFDWLALTSSGVLHGKIWTLATYLFLHGDFFHFFFNMFYLFMFGSIVERAWGKAAFLRYFFVTGVGSGLVWTLAQLGSSVPTIGASGAIYGILLAFAVLFPNSTVLLFFVLPVKAKYLVVGMIAIEAYYMIITGAAPGGVAHLIHLAGAAIGFFYMRRGISIEPIWERYRRWRTRRRLSVIDYRELMKIDDEDDRPEDRTRGR